jgi:antitoxin component YwqK of YwqJK toxin-antitoxin module
MRVVLILFLAAAGCKDGLARLKEPPRPEAVPAGAERDRRTGIWGYKTDKTWTLYNADGKKYAEGGLVLGLRQGEWKYYNVDGHTVLSRGKFLNDWREGVWDYNDTRGVLYLRMVYTQEPKRELIALLTHDYGNENGPYERHYPDGSIEETGSFQAGYYEGPITRFHPNGRLLLKGQYQKDLMVGRWLYYYPDGTILREENYVQGALDGLFRSYHPDGRLYVETHYEKGAVVGPVVIR